MLYCSMELEKAAVFWLYDSGGLDTIKKVCGKHENLPEDLSLLEIIFPLDILDLLQHNAELGQYVLHQPSKAWALFHKVSFTVIKYLDWLPSLKLSSQLVLLIRLLSVPNLPSYRVSHARDLPSAHEETRFFEITGRVISMSLPEKYTEQAVFVCSTNGCSGRYVSVRVVGASEALTTSCHRQCSSCGNSLQEDISKRILEDRIKFIMTCIEYEPSSKCEPNNCYRQQGVIVIVRKDLCKRVQLGSMVTVIGVPTHTSTILTHRLLIEITVEANNILKNFSPIVYTVSTIPSSILKIKEASSFSPWIFLQLLGYNFAMDICPPGCYHRLKTLMLLSLVCPTFNKSSDNVENYGSLDLLISGTDCIYLSNLLCTGSKLALSSVHHSSMNSLVAQQWKDPSTTYIDGGSLLFADKGICVIQHLEVFKKDANEKLQKALDTNELVCNVSHQPGKICSFTWSKSCTIWAQISHQNKSRNEEFQETVAYKGPLNAFALTIMTDPPDMDTRDYVSNKLMLHTLNTAKGELIENILPLTDLKEYLKMAMFIEAKLSEDATELLKAYYMYSRRMRSSSFQVSDVSIRTLNTLKLLACAHAKINLRKEATVEDAILSIFLCEESLASCFGFSTISVQPCSHFRPNIHPGAYVGVEFHDYMIDLRKKISEFCKYHGIPKFTPEE